MKRFLSFMLAVLMLFPVLGIDAAAANTITPNPDNQPLTAELKRQLDAYADTIDVENAGDEAFSALVDYALCVTHAIDFTIDFTATVDENGETIYRADISFTDYFDKNDKTVNTLISGLGYDNSFMKKLTSFTWTGSTSFTLNDYV